jgi:hypothetical protein
MTFALIPPALHAVLDYLLVLALAAGPLALRLDGGASALCWASAAILLADALLADRPVGLARALPLWAHGVIEASLGAFLLFMGLTTGGAGGLFLCVGLALLTLGALTPYRAVPHRGERLAGS